MNITFSDLNLLLTEALDEDYLILLNDVKVASYDYQQVNNILEFYDCNDVSLGIFSSDNYEITLTNECITFLHKSEKTRRLRAKIGLPTYDVLTISIVKNLRKEELISMLENLK